MDIRELRLFLHLAESCHFGKTAAAMYISPSTLSRQIQRLEESLGHPLFLRDNRTVQLTAAGEQLKKFAQETVLQYQQLQHALNHQSPSLTGITSVLFRHCRIQPSAADPRPVRAEHPQVEIKLTTGDAADAVEKVQSQDADLGIAGKPEKLPDNVRFHQIGEIPLSLIAPALPCPVRQQAVQPVPDWENIPFIIPEHGPSRKRIDLWFKTHRIQDPQIYATVSGHEAIVSMVALGCGIALIPNVVVENSRTQSAAGSCNSIIFRWLRRLSWASAH